MRKMVEAGEVDALVAERVWQEVARGLMEQAPSRMLAVLRDCGALARIMPELDDALAAGALVDGAAARGVALGVRFAVLTHALAPQQVEAVCARLKVPGECRDLAFLCARERAVLGSAHDLDAEQLVALFERCDGVRKPQRFADMLQALEPQGAPLLAALAAARAVNAGQVAAACGEDKAQIPRAVHAARVDAVRALLHG